MGLVEEIISFVNWFDDVVNLVFSNVWDDW